MERKNISLFNYVLSCVDGIPLERYINNTTIENVYLIDCHGSHKMNRFLKSIVDLCMIDNVYLLSHYIKSIHIRLYEDKHNENSDYMITLRVNTIPINSFEYKDFERIFKPLIRNYKLLQINEENNNS